MLYIPRVRQRTKNNTNNHYSFTFAKWFVHLNSSLSGSSIEESTMRSGWCFGHWSLATSSLGLKHWRLRLSTTTVVVIVESRIALLVVCIHVVLFCFIRWRANLIVVAFSRIVSQVYSWQVSQYHNHQDRRIDCDKIECTPTSNSHGSTQPQTSSCCQSMNLMALFWPHRNGSFPDQPSSQKAHSGWNCSRHTRGIPCLCR
mmetsp:Transcript_6667/g.10093  ORF Transcript_6667/g.10093 Transcript_6667/m.10093 type:complete len:201 (+) Transcript_6667:80-682(+)